MFFQVTEIHLSYTGLLRLPTEVNMATLGYLMLVPTTDIHLRGFHFYYLITKSPVSSRDQKEVEGRLDREFEGSHKIFILFTLE